MITQVPENSDYIIFPELVTIGLSAAFGEQDASSLSGLMNIPVNTKIFSSHFQEKENRSSLRARIWNAVKKK
ncbi:hypothetical protein M3699_14550 [Peribacillus simplex]|uniref:hypothetical protein n=1 Tax=Peribacillus simplex TaxID=1478 RepID=UPI00203C3429|nr:hypothetical protein [Peribacillus simplex]MCM3675072.1 hypothetical protein [Peribacillus simplex]